MEVEIYVDSLVLLHVLMNFGILLLIRRRFSLGVSKWRLLLAALAAALLYLLLFFVPAKSWWLSFLETIASVAVMLCIVLCKRKRHLFLKCMAWGFFYSFLMSGILRTFFYKWRLLTGREISLAALLFISYPVLQGIFMGIQKRLLDKKRSICTVKIKSGKHMISVKALVDTGNSLKEPISGKPVCLIEEKLLAGLTLENELYLRAIPFRSVGCEQGILYGVEVPFAEIQTEEQTYALEKIICAGVGYPLSKKGVYQMLLHPALLTEENLKQGKEE